MHASHSWLVAAVALLAASCTSDRVSGVAEQLPPDPSEPAAGPEADPPTQAEGNHSPLVRIEFPASGFCLYEGRGILFAGRAEDDEDGELTCESFEWSLDGEAVPHPEEWDRHPEWCGYGGWIDSVGVGSHVLTLSAADSEGARGSASVKITAVEFRDASFTDDILPFFGMYCVSCHGADRAEAGIRLDSYEAIITGENQHGPLIVEGDPTGGILIPQILSDHLYVDGYGLHVSQWMGEDIIPVWILEGARNTDHPHPRPSPGSC